MWQGERLWIERKPVFRGQVEKVRSLRVSLYPAHVPADGKNDGDD
jgi:hypothetical protein